MREKNPKTKKYETKEKDFPRLVAFPSPRLRNGDRLFSGVRKTPKTSQTYPRWDRGPSLVGQRNTGLGAVWVDRSSLYDFMRMNFQDLQQKGWSMTL